MNLGWLLKIPMRKHSNRKIIVYENSMASFYSRTFEIIEEHISTISNNEHHRDGLVEYIEMLSYFQISNEDHEKKEEINRQRQSLLKKFRSLTLISISKVEKDNRKILKSYHGVLHLLDLIGFGVNPYEMVLKKWLNTNCMIISDVERHAIRGNFEKVIEAYPYLNEAINNYLNLRKTSGNEYRKLFASWKIKYFKIIPNNLKEILFHNINGDGIDWIDHICYKSFCMNTQRNGIDLINREDEIGMILTHNYDALIERSKGWIRLVLLFVCPHTKFDLFPRAFESIGKFLYLSDYRLSLRFFSYTEKLILYFNHFSCKFSKSLSDLEFLVEYSKKNNINGNSLLKEYCQNLLSNQEYYNLFYVISKYELCDININSEFIEFCIRNTTILTENFTKTSYGIFIGNFRRFLSGIKVGEGEIIALINSDYFSALDSRTFEIILENRCITVNMLYKLLEGMLNVERKGKSNPILKSKKALVLNKLAESTGLGKDISI
ncbi:uncharacterized protein Eint_060660 [Encephalitozoon intestinalis ATCC 50506]|uniref:Nuclear pore complex protein Nup85 n=1 Tax=Encephalitozoon intestinalis (strain ATCC 50506) TaxID=876142 RepID=E0S7J5_ENCIT|nr:uncharacterized protein Eint_060660 [Encephalitozoon intestinalis ATCC 50506]ADM11674.1 hypothetical protein Eint_060660 [Encephalitozoon intestinalis ATCC 50506]UTX45411.1 hypothetical protein GPK93_06g09630 [Encephalitozoon intestinalis]